MERNILEWLSIYTSPYIFGLMKFHDPNNTINDLENSHVCGMLFGNNL